MTNFTCRDGSALLMDYLEDVLPAGLRAAVDAHLSACPRCVAFVGSYRATPRILRESTAFELPDGLAESLRRFLAGRRKPEA
jgi:anti-sigma factor RsiW